MRMKNVKQAIRGKMCEIENLTLDGWKPDDKLDGWYGALDWVMTLIEKEE